MKRASSWRPARGSVWDYIDPTSGSLVTVKVAGTFDTTEGPYANVRGILADESYGNTPVRNLLERETQR